MVLSEETRRLAGREFAYEDLGVKSLKGVQTPLQVYRVIGERPRASRFEAAAGPSLTPLVGREEELALLSRRWEQARAGEGQVVLISGEAGIGKSRLAHTLRERVAHEPRHCVQYQCSPYYRNSPFYPLMVQVERAAQFARDDTPGEKLAKLEAVLFESTEARDDVVPLVAALMSIPTGDRYPALTLSAQQQRAKTINVLADYVVGLARHQPLCVIIEDVHWSDPTTLEVLDAVVNRALDLRVLVVLTARPEFDAGRQLKTHFTVLTLNRLSLSQSAAMVEQLTVGGELCPVTREDIIAKADGIPLFIEEVTRAVVEVGRGHEDAGRDWLTGSLPREIPSTLQGLLMARLDRLGSVEEVAQLGAALGREFTYERLAAVAGWRDADLQEALDQLVESGLLFRHGHAPECSYRFKHALVQDAAYGSLLKRERQQLHTGIAQVMKDQFPTQVESEPELLAHHYTEAGLVEQAIGYWQRAGQRASERSAYQETLSHLRTGLRLLQSLPETLARHQQELPLQLALGAASLVVRGHGAAEVEAAYTRARVLCQQLGDTPEVFSVLLGLWRFWVAQPDYPLARQLGEDLLALAERRDETPLYVAAHYALGFTYTCLGELLPAYRQLEAGIARYTPAHRHFPLFRAGHDPGVACRAYAGCMLWQLGYPDQALARAHDALALASELDHPFSDAHAFLMAAIVCQFRREEPDVYAHTEAAIALSIEQGFTLWLAASTFFRGWALTTRGQRKEGLRQMHQGLTAWRATGAESIVPFFLALLAEAYGHVEQVKEGLDTLKEGWEVMEHTGEHLWKAELYRLKGALLLKQAVSDASQAEACFHEALSIARHQQAKSLELRTATSLARLWQHQDKRQEAYDLLTPVYEWFTEGFETADLQDAKRLLEELNAEI